MIITRIPPSPTGHLHIGTARTALFNYLFAKQQGGKVVFRSEDTDRARSTPAFEQEIIEGLNWLGITWDNDPIVRQSERVTVYRKYLEQMISSGSAYLSTEESKNEAGKMVTVVRLKNPNKAITFTDLVRGEITFDTTELGDIVIARSLDDALYHFTVVVDDHEMGVTHVIRGEDHISNTPRQILIQEALGFGRPIYAHLPLILATDRSKMSKRHGATAIVEYQKLGFTKEAIINYLALLGWNPGTNEEIFTLEKLIEVFKLEQVQKSGAVFDLKKFEWFNKEHLRHLTSSEFGDYLALATEEHKPAYFDTTSTAYERLLPVLKERTVTRGQCLQEINADDYDWVFVMPIYEPELLQWKNDPNIQVVVPRLQKTQEILATADFSTPESIKASLMPYADEVGKGEVLWPLRMALTGKKQSPDPFTVAYIIGMEESLSRIALACDKIGK